jgi:hypothetical protein
MESSPLKPIEKIQECAARLVATSPAGHRLCLVGGYRYRLLDRSARLSLDIDYHWAGDLAEKQGELQALLRKKLLPEVESRFGLAGTVRRASGADVDSPSVQTLDLAFFRTDVPGSRIEIPIDITCIPCLDPPVARTAGGTVHLTVSDGDMVESKVIALFDRIFLKERDMVDLFLFCDSLLPDSRARLERKLALRSLSRKSVEASLVKMREDLDVHARAVDRILEDQVDAPVAENLKLAGGGRKICEVVSSLLETLLGPEPRTKA